jgi:hypothetical protein
VFVSTPVLRQILALRPSACGDDDPLLMLPAPGGWKPVAGNTIDRCLNLHIGSACKALKLPRFTMQALRRLAAQERARWAVRNGGSLAAGAKQSGHTVQTFMQYYEAAREDEVKASAAALDYALVPVEVGAEVVPIRRAERIRTARHRRLGPGEGCSTTLEQKSSAYKVASCTRTHENRRRNCGSQSCCPCLASGWSRGRMSTRSPPGHSNS